jgi:nicotinate-nucleotide pyrophosphorylase (carboxylating)
MAARQPGAGRLDTARFRAARIRASRFERQCRSKAGQRGQAVARISGRARPVLAAERTALNLICRPRALPPDPLAGRCDRGHKAKIVCTRKMTPGLRILEKEAVRPGGGANHRFGLDDAMLIKDNHIALGGRRGA